MSNLKTILVKSTIWTSIGQIVTLLIALVTNIWLARMLTPIEFGQVGVIMFFINLFTILTEGGLGGALVRKRVVESVDYSTVFVSNLMFSILLYLVLFLFAGNIASFYNDSNLKKLLQVAGVILVINAFQIVQNTKLIVELRFKRKIIYSFIAVFLSSLIGVILAYLDYGVWSLIIMQVLVSVFNTLLLWIFESSKVSFVFSRKSFKELFSFGINTTFASVLNVGFDNIYQLIFAKYFSFIQNGFYYQAKRLQDVPGNLFINVSQTVLYSSLAKFQNRPKIFLKVFSTVYLYYNVLLGGVCAVSYVYSDEIIGILYGNKWAGTGYFMKLLAISLFFFSLENLNRQIFKIFNYANKVLIIEFLKKMILIISIFYGLSTSNINVLLYGMIISNFIGYCYSSYLIKRVIGINLKSSMILFYKQCCLLIFLSAMFCFVHEKLLVFNALYSVPFFVLIYFQLLKYIGIIDLFKVFLEKFKYVFKKFI